MKKIARQKTFFENILKFKFFTGLLGLLIFILIMLYEVIFN